MSIKWDRRAISKPGCYQNIPIKNYHSGDLCEGPSISSSGLRKLFRESPAHYWATSPLNLNRIEEPESGALVLGRAAHHLLLGEDNFSTLFIMRPERWDSWRANDAKTWKAEQEDQGRTVLIPQQIERIRGMARSLAAHPLVRAGILNGEIEQSLVWKDEETGIWLKARPDAIPNDSGDFADLKTCESVKTEALERAIGSFGLPQQGALVNLGAHKVLKLKNTSFSLVFVESEPPHCVRIVTMRDEDLARGERQNRAALHIFAKCLASNEWPGPGTADAEYLGLPSWDAKKIDDALEQMESA